MHKTQKADPNLAWWENKQAKLCFVHLQNIRWQFELAYKAQNILLYQKVHLLVTVLYEQTETLYLLFLIFLNSHRKETEGRGTGGSGILLPFQITPKK